MKKAALFFVVFLLFSFATLAQAPGQNQQQQELAKYIRENYDKQEVMIAMRDGVRLFTSIYTPETKSQKYPILLNRTPYTVSPYGKDKDGKDQFKGSLGPDPLFAKEGYIFVYNSRKLIFSNTACDICPSNSSRINPWMIPHAQRATNAESPPLNLPDA